MITCRNVKFTYPQDPFGLAIPELIIDKGQSTALVGPSGCGKTTLINLMAGILTPKTGSIEVSEIEISKYNSRDRADFRIAKLGLIFQEFELLDYLSVVDNVLLPYRINPIMKLDHETKARAEILCQRVGLGNHMHKHPGNLSQGERQRVAVCRALVTEPTTVLGDEPTANLDPVNRDNILQILFEYCETNDATIVMVTHDSEVVKNFSRIVDVRNFNL